MIVGVAGPEALFLASAGMAAAAGATIWRPAPVALTGQAGSGSQPRLVVFSALAELREHPWSRGVLGVSSARNIVIGAFDVLLVILALDALGLGSGGPGLLSALVGAGALASTMVASHLTFASEPPHRMALIAEALELAHRHRDPALLGVV